MENIDVQQEMVLSKEKQVIKKDIDAYIEGLSNAFMVKGKRSDSPDLDKVYANANSAGDRLFDDPDRTKGVIRKVGFIESAMNAFGGMEELKDGLNEYRNKMLKYKTEYIRDGHTKDTLLEDIISLREKLIGKDVSRVIF